MVVNTTVILSKEVEVFEYDTKESVERDIEEEVANLVVDSDYEVVEVEADEIFDELGGN